MTNETLIDAAEVIDVLSTTVGEWDGVSTEPHRFGGVEFRVGRREVGHVHAIDNGRSFADLPFPKRVRDELIDAGRAYQHHALPDSGWVTFPIRTTADLDQAVALFRLNLERDWR